MQFENKITLGNVLTIIALVLGLSVGYSNLDRGDFFGLRR